MFKCLQLFFLAIAFCSSGLAQEGTPPPKVTEIPPFPFPEEEVQGDGGHFASQLLQMFMMLGLLLGLLLFASWFLKKMMHSRIQQVNNSSAIKVLEQRVISPRTTVYALDIEGKTYIFAETANAITALHPITDK